MLWKLFAFFNLFLITRMPLDPQSYDEPAKILDAVLVVLVTAGLLAYATKLVPLQSGHKKTILFWKAVAVLNIIRTLFGVFEMARDQLPSAYAAGGVKFWGVLLAIALAAALGFFSSLGVWLYASKVPPAISGRPNPSGGIALKE